MSSVEVRQSVAHPRIAQGGPSQQKANSITVEGLGVVFSNGFVGLKSTDLFIPDGEFCTMLGPSGSGKTTLLRAIAGLTTPTSGRIMIGSKDVTRLPIQARNVGFVFQNYALFPHMNVAENIEYPLKLHNWPAAERAKRIQEILELVELPALQSRAVGELSGGQQQRVAIARALVYRPSILLLDEPMGALDRRLRQQLGADLRDIQKRACITAVYVTHDQEEAFILSDRIAVMSGGEILQYAAPSELYFRPHSRFVAEFLGEANFVDVQGLADRPSGEVDATTSYGPVPVSQEQSKAAGPTGLALVVRPEDVVLTDRQDQEPGHITPIKVDILREIFLGSRCLVTVRAPDGKEFLVECPKSKLPDSSSESWMTWMHSASVLVER